MKIKLFFFLFVAVFQLEAEAVPEVSEKYEISSVPTFLFFKVSEDRFKRKWAFNMYTSYAARRAETLWELSEETFVCLI